MIPTVAGLLADRDEFDVFFAGERGGPVEAAVGDHHELSHLLGTREEAAGERDGLLDAGRSFARSDRFQGGAQGSLVVGRPADHAGAGPGLDDRQLIAGPHAVDQAPAFVPGRLEPAGSDITGIHA